MSILKKDQDKSILTVKKDRNGKIVLSRLSGNSGGELRGSIRTTNDGKPYLVGGKGIKITSGSTGYPDSGQIQIEFDLLSAGLADALSASTTSEVSKGDKGDRGSIGPAGRAGSDGRDGRDGTDGSGIASITLDSSNNLKFEMSNGTFFNSGPLNVSGISNVSSAVTSNETTVTIVWDGGSTDIVVPHGQDGADGMPGAPGASGTDGANGQDGTDGSDGQDGQDGTSIISAEVDCNTNHLIFSLSDGSTIDVGSLGISEITSVDNGTDTTISIEYLNNKFTNFVLPHGEDAINITSATLDELNNLIFTMEDGTEVNAGEIPNAIGISDVVTTVTDMSTDIAISWGDDVTNISLPHGVDGTDGADGTDGLDGTSGLSAYELWLAEGNVGTISDFMSYLVGASGSQGAAGIDGIDGSDGSSAYELWLAAGNTGTIEEFLDSLSGTDGTDGSQGNSGSSAYTIWLGAGNTGTIEDFLDSLVGEQGTQGADGADGSDGAVGPSGLSAYELWLAAGNAGTIEEFLESLVGTQGIQGVQGIQGITGQDGADGADGTDGVPGQDGTDGQDGADGIDGQDGTDGVDGTDGQDGVDGSSAYMIWLGSGNTGTIEEFLESLIGEQGPQGPAGTGGGGGGSEPITDITSVTHRNSTTVTIEWGEGGSHDVIIPHGQIGNPVRHRELLVLDVDISPDVVIPTPSIGDLSGFSPEMIDVYVNGVLQFDTMQYNIAGDGSGISFTRELESNDFIHVTATEVVIADIPDIQEQRIKGTTLITEDTPPGDAIVIPNITSLLDYSLNQVDVFKNGVLQLAGASYHYTLGADGIVFTEQVEKNDIISVIIY